MTITGTLIDNRARTILDTIGIQPRRFTPNTMKDAINNAVIQLVSDCPHYGLDTDGTWITVTALTLLSGTISLTNPKVREILPYLAAAYCLEIGGAEKENLVKAEALRVRYHQLIGV